MLTLIFLLFFFPLDLFWIVFLCFPTCFYTFFSLHWSIHNLHRQCPLRKLDTNFVLSVTTKPSFAISRSAFFYLTISDLCRAVGLPSASLCPIFYHPIPVLLCAASCIPTAQGPCYCTKLVFLHTVLCLSEKCLILHRMGETKGVTAFTRCHGTSGISVSAQILSPVSTSVPLSGCILLDDFTRSQQDPSTAHQCFLSSALKLSPGSQHVHVGTSIREEET